MGSSSANLDCLDLDHSRVHPYLHQVGGHRVGDGNAESRDVIAFQHSDGRRHLLKPLQNDERGIREAFFYQKRSPEFARFTPDYFGLYRSGSPPQMHVCLQDCLAGLRHPCVADIKIGRVTYDEMATADKIEKEIANYKWQSEIGFRFVGVKTYCQKTSKDTLRGKPFGKSITPANVNDAWRALFDCGHSASTCVALVRESLTRLREIAAFVRKQKEFRMYSSSLLFAYDGHPVEDGTAPTVTIHMIDFGHAFPINGDNILDHNYMFGVDRLITSLEQYCPDATSTQGTSSTK